MISKIGLSLVISFDYGKILGYRKLKPLVIGSIVIGLIVPMLVSTYYSFLQTSSQLSKEAQSDHKRIAEVLALGLQKTVWDYAPEQGRALLLAFISDERICKITVRDTNNNILLEEKRDERRLGNVFTQSLTIEYNSKVIGKVEVDFSFAGVSKTANERALANFFLALLQVVSCGLILTFVITRRILIRLKKITKEAESLANRDLDFAFLWKDQDEIDHLGNSLEKTRISLRQLFKEIEDKNLELAKINAHLEEKVRERTASLAVVLDNVASGFLLVNRELRICEGYSKICEKLFLQNNLNGKILTQVMGLNEREANHFQLSIDQVFENILPEKVALYQIPERVRTKNRVFSVFGKAIREDLGSISGVLLTINDATALEHSENEVHYNRAIIKILQNISSFREFVDESRAIFTHGAELIEQGDEQKLRRDLHTLKGNLSTFGLNMIVDIVHKIEDSATVDKNDLKEIEVALQKFLEDNIDLIKISYFNEQEEVYEISKMDLWKLEKDTRNVRIERQIDTVLAWIEDVQKVPVMAHISHLPAYAEKLGRQLNKEIKLEISGANLKVDAKKLKPVLQNLVHLLRNAIDHGIEKPAKRKEKPKIGTVLISFAEYENMLEIVISDDGAGIDLECLIDKAIERNIVDKESVVKMSEAQKYGLIFIDGVSTSSVVSEVSGRGIGMASVKASIESLKGTIAINSTPGKGTSFKIAIPLDY